MIYRVHVLTSIIPVAEPGGGGLNPLEVLLLVSLTIPTDLDLPFRGP